jgi:hypothetical protein
MLCKGKGKGKAVDPPLNEPVPLSAEEQVAYLKKELAFKNEVWTKSSIFTHTDHGSQLIEKHQNAVTQTQQAITCQVCLELMYKPYALSPCGHLACYECLVSWFKASPEDRPAPPPVLMRKKTCPHCRAAITDRPVQVWGIKSIVSNFSKSGLLQGTFLPQDESSHQNGNENENADPWDGIFRKVGHFGHGIGVEQLEMVEHALGGAGILDDEDGGIYRCYHCLHEIWNGVCSNCGRRYHNLDEDDEDDYEFGHELGSDDEDFDQQWIPLPQAAHDHVLAEIEAERALNEGANLDMGRFFPVDDEDEYEGSFIDDEDDVGIPHLPAHRSGAANVIEVSSGSDDDEDMPLRRRRPLPNHRREAPSSRRSPIDVSDDDEIREIRRPTRNGVRSSRRGTGAGPIVILTDSDGEDIVENSPGSSRGVGARRRGSSRTTRNHTDLMSTDNDNDSNDGIDP